MTQQLSQTALEWIDRLSGSKDEPYQLVKLAANMSIEISRNDRLRLVLMARKMQPESMLLRAMSARTLASAVPNWHFEMLRDTKRNQAYATAINASVNDESIVLEIGTGSGILAMMAARAGAKHVYTVENSPVFAELARDVISENGLSEKITVVEKDFLKVQIGSDIPVKCNCLLHEVIADNIVSEHVVKLTQYAREALLTENPVFLPTSATAQIRLSERDCSESVPPSEIEGFSFSALTLLDSGIFSASHDQHMDALSETLAPLHFDFTGQVAAPRQRQTLNIQTNRAGQARAIQFWFSLQFPDGTTFENVDQPEGLKHWRHEFFRLDGRNVNAGESLSIECVYRNASIYFFNSDIDLTLPVFGWNPPD